MKKLVLNAILLMVFIILGTILNAQSSNEWSMVLNNDHSSFTIKIINNQLTFYFDNITDTLSFSQGNKKPIKSGCVIEIMIKNNNKVIFTSTDKNLNSDKTKIVVPMSDVYNSLKGIKLPTKPIYLISIKDENVVKEILQFNFFEK
ncbi:MAG: hypothetical protein PHD61_04680 [Bacteroidales bacterium]|nr:hypothetical protein [Lentimicrobiaceae bacterium]MDD5694585.1 hypothetical protein [Bacteroidales bacterium]